uniref:Putative 5.3 kDa protein n=1 Tax=Ixodes ricinus TaxID=34613 RepID=A0A147BGX7_IXORI
MRATKLVLMAVSLLITANLVRTCIRGNDGYKKEADKYCNKPRARSGRRELQKNQLPMLASTACQLVYLAGNHVHNEREGDWQI